MPKINTRAIQKLIAAIGILERETRHGYYYRDGIAFASQLIRLIESGKPIELVIADDKPFRFHPDDLRISKSTVTFGGGYQLSLKMIGSDDAEFTAVRLVDDNLGETVPVRMLRVVDECMAA